MRRSIPRVGCRAPTRRDSTEGDGFGPHRHGRLRGRHEPGLFDGQVGATTPAGAHHKHLGRMTRTFGARFQGENIHLLCGRREWESGL